MRAASRLILATLLIGLALTIPLVWAATGTEDQALISGPRFPVGASADVTTPTELPLLHRLGGPVQNAVVKDDLAYLTAGGVLQIVDVSQPHAPVLLGESPSHNVYARDLAVSGTVAYFADGNGVQLVDVSDPAAPRLAGGDYIGDSTVAVDVADGYAYVATRFGPGVHVFSVIDIDAPVEIGAWELSCACEVWDVSVRDDIAYVAASDGYGLRVLDVSDPAVPAERGFLLGDFRHVTVAETYAYLSGGASPALTLVDVSEPLTPTLVATLPIAHEIGPVAVQGDLAVAAAGEVGVMLFDITEPANPLVLATVDTVGDVMDVDFYGEHVVVSRRNGWSILDVADPSSVAYVHQTVAPARVRQLAAPADDYAFALDDDAFYTLAVGTSLTVVGHLPIEGDEPVSMTIGDGLAFVRMYGEDALLIIDITDPAAPELVTAYATPVPVRGDGAYRDGLVFAPIDQAGLLILDVSDPSLPTVVATLSLPDRATTVALEGDFAYVGSLYGDRVHIVDVSDPSAPQRVSAFLAPDVRGLDVAMGTVAVAGQNHGIQLVDVTQPLTPVQLGSYDGSGTVYATVIGGDRVYATNGIGYPADGIPSVLAVDFANPAAPSLAAASYVQAFANDLALLSDLILVGTDSGVYAYSTERQTVIYLPAIVRDG